MAKKGAKNVSRTGKAGLTFPVGRVGSLLRQGRFSKRVSSSAAVFLAATLEYLMAETLELASKTVAGGSKRITPRALMLAIRYDADLGSLLQNVTIASAGALPTAGAGSAKKAKAAKATGAKKKTGGATKGSAVAAPTIAGLTRQESAQADKLFQKGTVSHKWQFKNDYGTWSDYAADASREVERAYAAWVVNPHIDVRSVMSGSWNYMVDFNLMQQQNIQHQNHRVREIRRVAV
jgi:histone H2A